MRGLYVLTRREVEDHAFLFALVFILGCIYAGMVYVEYPTEVTHPYGIPGNVIGLSLMLFAFLSAGIMILGYAQIAGDRRAGISTFVSTVTATRSQILLAKWFSALAWMGLGLLPALALHAVMLPGLGLDGSVLGWIMVGGCMTVLTAYAAGQRTGLQQNHILSLLMLVSLVFLVASILIIKGIGLSGLFLQGILIVALSGRTWRIFHDSVL
jgi:hypothetical protein